MTVQRPQPRTRMALVASLALVLLAPHMAFAQHNDENPSALAMAGDLVVARPIGLVATVLGSAAFVVSLPFSLAGGNVGQAAETLVVGPAKTTFVRCLGCTRTGYRRDVEMTEDDE